MNYPFQSDSEIDSGAAQPPAVDAPASNRASERYKDEERALYWKGVDSLEFSLRGESKREVVQELDRLKELARSPFGQHQAEAVITLGGRRFQVGDKGSGRFRFVLRDPDYFIRLRGGEASALPLALVQIRSHHLAQVGPVAAKNEAVAFCAALGEVVGSETVSRIDLAVDFASDGCEEAVQRREWVTRAGYRRSHSKGDRFTGWSIGQEGPTSFRLYDKFFEVVTESPHKAWLLQIWSSRGWFHGDPVWRAEFQLRRPTLKTFGLTSLDSVLDALPGLWTYLTGDWLRLAVPSEGDENRARWRVHLLWAFLADVKWGGRQLEVAKVKVTPNAPLDKFIVRQLKAVLTTEMAKEGIWDPYEAHLSIWRKLEAQGIDAQEWEGASLETVLQSTALIKERRFGTFRLSQAMGALPAREPGEEG